MKTFGLIVPSAKGGRFEKEVRRLLAGRGSIENALLPLLEAWIALADKKAPAI